MEHLLPILALLSDPMVIVAVLGGVVVGTFIGMLPGLGAVIALTLFLPFTFAMDQMPAIVLMLSLYVSTIYGGSITAVLINTPGVPSSAVTALDGYPMTMRGEGGLALGYATVASVIGGLFSVAVLLLAAPQLAEIAIGFTPYETAAIILMGLTTVATVSRGSMLKGLMAGAIGLALATVGSDPMTGDVRFAFDIFQLSAGIGLIPVVVGIFAISEVFWRAGEDPTESEKVKPISDRFRLPGFADLRVRWAVILKSSAIGSFIGALPGTGATIAAFISYGEAQRTSPNAEKFGTGEPDGIIAAEAANNAVTGGALVPTLALGIPGDAVTAIMLSVLAIHGITPGVRLFAENTEVVYATFVALGLINLVLLLVGAIGCRYFRRIGDFREDLLMPVVLVLALVGAWSVRNNIFDVGIAIIAGFVGFLLRRMQVPLAPIVIGMVLGPRFEEAVRRAFILSDGELGPFLERPIAVGLFILTLLLLSAPLIRSWVKQKRSNPSLPG